MSATKLIIHADEARWTHAVQAARAMIETPDWGGQGVAAFGPLAFFVRRNRNGTITVQQERTP